MNSESSPDFPSALLQGCMYICIVSLRCVASAEKDQPLGLVSFQNLPCYFHSVTPTVSLCHCVCAPQNSMCAFVTCPPVPHGALRSHTVKETLPRGRMPIPNQLTVSAAGNPPAHKEARYDTTALQAREGARDSIDTASTFVWENP